MQRVFALSPELSRLLQTLPAGSLPGNEQNWNISAGILYIFVWHLKKDIIDVVSILDVI
jgi:hypothetical protein